MSEAATFEGPRPRARSLGARARRLRAPVPLCLSLALVASLTLLLVLDSHLTFYGDDWWFLVYRRGWSPAVLLDPHLDHIAIAPVLIYKVLLAVFGMRSAMPFHVVSTSVFVLGAGLLFAYVRRRVGGWLALMGAVLILFFGPSWIDLLWAFQLGYFGSIAAGLGALLALDREDRTGDLIACLLLVVAVSFSELGIPFAVGALVRVALARPLRLDRLYIPLVPAFLYALWWLGWGHAANTLLSVHNVANSPGYVIDAASAGISALLGLSTSFDGNPTNSNALDWGRPLLLVLVLLAGWRFWRLRGVPRGVWVALAIGATFWFGAAFNQGIGRAPDNGRYLYPSAVFVVLIAAEVLRGASLRTRGLLAAAVVTAAALCSNLASLDDGYKYFKGGNDQVRTDLAALELARPSVKPGYAINGQISGIWLLSVDAGAYFSAIDAYGSPAYSRAQLASRSEPQLLEADTVLAAALGLRLRPAGGSASKPCRVVEASPSGAAVLHLGTGDVTLRARAARPIKVTAGRLSPDLPVDLGSLQPGQTVSLAIPPDRSTRPWNLGLRGYGSVQVCGAARA